MVEVTKGLRETISKTLLPDRLHCLLEISRIIACLSVSRFNVFTSITVYKGRLYSFQWLQCTPASGGATCACPRSLCNFSFEVCTPCCINLVRTWKFSVPEQIKRETIHALIADLSGHFSKEVLTLKWRRKTRYYYKFVTEYFYKNKQSN